MFYIGNHQFLMLLFMVQAKHNDRRKFRKLSLIYLVEEVKNSLINIATIQVCLLNSRSRKQASYGPSMASAKRVVIGVKEVPILWMKGCVPRKRRGKEKGLPEPSHMGEMPFRRAHVRHRL